MLYRNEDGSSYITAEAGGTSYTPGDVDRMRVDHEFRDVGLEWQARERKGGPKEDLRRRFQELEVERHKLLGRELGPDDDPETVEQLNIAAAYAARFVHRTSPSKLTMVAPTAAPRPLLVARSPRARTPRSSSQRRTAGAGRARAPDPSEPSPEPEPPWRRLVGTLLARLQGRRT